MHYKLTGPVRVWDPKQPVNSPCRDRKGPVRAPYGQIQRPCGIFVNSGCINPLRVRKGVVRRPCGSRTGPVWFRSRRIWKNIEDSPLRAPYDARMGIARVPVESCESFDQTIMYSRVRAHGAHSLMWPREQHWRKIPTGTSLGLTGFSWNLGKIKKMRVWSHSRKATGVNPA